MSAELAARITAARAVEADFTRATDGFLDQGAPEPAWQDWAWRMNSELRLLLCQIDPPKGDS
jgi:hypothetical protein